MTKGQLVVAKFREAVDAFEVDLWLGEELLEEKPDITLLESLKSLSENSEYREHTERKLRKVHREYLALRDFLDAHKEDKLAIQEFQNELSRLVMNSYTYIIKEIFNLSKSSKDIIEWLDTIIDDIENACEHYEYFSTRQVLPSQVKTLIHWRDTRIIKQIF